MIRQDLDVRNKGSADLRAEALPELTLPRQ